MRKNAGFKSKDDLARVLLAGNECYFNKVRLHYDSAGVSSPFLCDCDYEPMGTLWECFSQMEIEVESNWYDQLDGTEENAVLCWVSDRSKEDRKLVSKIIKTNRQGMLVSTMVCFWKYATPVRPDECWQENNDGN